MTTISVFGSSPPPGTFGVFTDNPPSITPGGRFYRYGGQLPDASIVGGRVWLPAAAPGSTQVKIMLWLSGEINTTPDREVTVNLGATPGWAEGLFSSPAAMPADGIPFRIAYQFVGNPATYVYANDFRTDATNQVIHPQFNGITYSEAQSIFRDGSGPESTPGSFAIYYGVDVLVDDGTTPAEPNDPPVANAGVDQSVEVGTPVTLAGSGTDGDGTIIGHSWTQISGTAVSLAGSGATRTFTPATAGLRTFRLTVTDDDGAIGQDTMTVAVVAAPVVDPDPVQPGSPAPVAKLGSIERALLELLVRDLDILEGSDALVGGDWPRETGDFYIRIDRGPGGRTTSFEGDFVVDIDVFSPDYLRAESISEDIEVLLLSHGIVSVVSDGRKWTFDGIFQNRGITDLPWDGDDDTHRLSSTYAFTVRRGRS